MQQKIKFFENNTLKLTRYYFGSYERDVKDGVITHIDYINTPSGLSAIRRTVSPPEGELEGGLYYTHLDNMGSLQVITDNVANIVNEWYYTPWGGRLRIDDNTETSDVTDRGYTGHEHLTALSLINMNGRIYDPVLARFLSPDPYVQAPDFTQAFNRYSYCWNNPFKYTDPNGEFIQYILAGLIYLAYNYYQGYKANGNEPNPAKWNWGNANYMFGYSSDGNSFYVGLGWGNAPATIVGYSSNYGAGVGLYNNGTSNMFYPAYNYYAPEQAAIAAHNNMMQNIAGLTGSAFSTYAGVHYTKNLWGGGHWIGKNGTMYDMSLLDVGTHKGQGFYRNSANLARSSTSLARGIGNGIGALLTIYSAYQFKKDPNWEDGINLGVGVGSLIYWPIGAVYSYGYGSYLYGVTCTQIQFNNLDPMREIFNSNESFWQNWFKLQGLQKIPKIPGYPW